MNKRINTFDTEEQYDNYIWSTAPEFPNVGYVKESDTIHYQKEALNDYTIYGTTTNTADFTLSLFGSVINCTVEENETSGVHMFHSTDAITNLKTQLIGFNQYSERGTLKNDLPTHIKSIIKLKVDNTSILTAGGLYITGYSVNYINNPNITKFDVTSIDTSNMTTMACMFQGCESLISLNLSNFNTSKVTDMNSMFRSCSSLTTLDLSNFDTSNVTDMMSMFANLDSIKKLNVSNFDTSNVTNMSTMFANMLALEELDLSNFDMNNVTQKGSMFISCTSLKKVYVTNCDETTQQSLLTSLKSVSSSFTLSNGVISRP